MDFSLQCTDLSCTLSWSSIALLFGLAMLAGFVDSIAGGGGLLTLPALMWLGLPPLQALATNKLQGTFGTMTSSLHFYRKGYMSGKKAGWIFAAAFIGSAIGAWAVSQFEMQLLEQLIPLLLIVAAIYFLFSSRLSNIASRQRISFVILLLLPIPVIGFYDGFFGPGTGSFFVLAYLGLMGMTATTATAWSKLANFATNLAALLVFISMGKVIWLVGGIMATGQVLGAWTGSFLVMRHGVSIVRPMLVFMSVLISVKLLFA